MLGNPNDSHCHAGTRATFEPHPGQNTGRQTHRHETNPKSDGALSRAQQPALRTLRQRTMRPPNMNPAHTELPMIRSDSRFLQPLRVTG